MRPAVAAGLLALASACALPAPARALETIAVPAIFEDFEAPSAVNLYAIPARGGVAARWKIEVLVPAGELGEGRLTLRRVGVRGDGGAGPEGRTLRGSVTLSTLRSDRLRERFAENAGEAAVTFFVEAKPVPTRKGGRRTAYLFELPGGFSLDPAIDGNLHVHFELQADADTRLDAAPSPGPRLHLASDILAPARQLSSDVLVLLFTIDREPSPLADLAGRVDLPPAHLPPRPRGKPARAGGRDPAAAAEKTALLGQVRSLEERIARLEARLADYAEAQETGMRAIIDHVSSIANLVSRHYLESALASGRASPAMLRGEGEYLERGRDLVSEAVKLAREGGLDARGAERLLAEGDGRLSRGENGLAFVSYSLAFRSVLKLWRPFEAVPPAGGSDATLAADGPRAAPYDVD